MPSHPPSSPGETERLRRLNALLEEALALEPEARAPWLTRQTPTDDGLLASLRSLLARAEIETDTFLNRPAAEAMEALAAAELRRDEPGDGIGPWRLLDMLGEGGMGQVWLVERADGGLARRVALKLPRLGFSAGQTQRWVRERDLLAALEHPRIARLYDAGVTDQGRSWLALEYVSGRSIDLYCQEERLDTNAVLRLALQICEALAHAHARLIVHRDLKPANVLVTPDGEVRLLDFGVGKLLQDAPAGLTAPPGLTQVAGNAMTLAYASPEQVAGAPVAVATDVYSLAVLMYELLSGARPYQPARSSAAALEEAILCVDPPPASSRCADKARARQLRGDLDAVLAKALAKDPSKRHATVEALAADIQAYLEGRPVSARALSRLDRVHKFLRRNTGPVVAVSAVVLSLAGGLGAALWQAHAARTEAHRAEQARRFITGLLREAQPRQGSSGTAGAARSADLLVRAGARIEKELSDAPLLAAELGILIGERLSELGEAERGQSVLRAAVSRAQAGLGPRHPLTVHGRALLTDALSIEHPDEALRLASALVPDALAGLPTTAGDAVLALRSQSFQLAKLNQSEASIRALKDALAIAERHLGAHREETLFTLGLLSNTLGRFGPIEQQLETASEAYRRAQSALGSSRPHTVLSAIERWYGEALRRNHRPADALPLLRQVLADVRLIDPTELPRVRNASYQLALALNEVGHFGEGIPLLEQVVAMEARQNNVFNEDRLSFHRAYIAALSHARRVEQAERALQALRRLEAEAAQPHSGAARITPRPGHEIRARLNGARVAALQGATREAGAALERVRQEAEQLSPRDANLEADLGQLGSQVARLQGDYALAAHRAQTAWNAPVVRSARPSARAALAAELAAARLALGDRVAAQAINREALSLFEQAQVKPSPLSATAWITQARLDLLAGRPRAAHGAMDLLVAAWAESHPDSEWHAEARHWRGTALRSLGRVKEAQADLRTAAARLRSARHRDLRSLVAG